MTVREDRLPGTTLARIARRLVTPEAYQRVLSPLLADYQHEYSRAVGLLPRARVRSGWLLAFWRSLAVEGVWAGGLHLARNAWGRTGAEVATTWIFARCLALCAAWLVLMVVVLWLPRGAADRAGTAFLLPSVLAFVFPVACLFAALVATRLRGGADLRLRSMVGVAALAGVVTFVNSAWITPEANYAFKGVVWKEQSRLHPEVPVGIFRGDREMSVNALVDRAADLRHRSHFAEAVHLETEIHKRAALAAWCLAFAFLGTALVRRIPGLVVHWATALAASWTYYAVLRLGEQAAEAGRISPAVALWTPVLVATALAGAALWHSRSP